MNRRIIFGITLAVFLPLIIASAGAVECEFDEDCNDSIECTVDTCNVGTCEYDYSACECEYDEDCDDSDNCTDDQYHQRHRRGHRYG